MNVNKRYMELEAWVHNCLPEMTDRIPQTPFERLFDKVTDAMEQYEKETLPPPLGNATPVESGTASR